MFWQNYNDICEANKVRPRKIAAELGIAEATVTRWKNGSIPSRSTLEKISERFGVSVEYLLGNNDIVIDFKDKITKFKSFTSLPQRWASFQCGQSLDKHLVADISDYVNVDWLFLRDDTQIRYVPEKKMNTGYKIYCLKNMETLHLILDIMDDCADSDEYRKVQIQLSRIVLSHLADKGIDQEWILSYDAISPYKLDFLYTGKENIEPTHNYGLNFSDLSVLHRKTKLDYLFMFTGIEKNYAEIIEIVSKENGNG